MSEYPRLTIRLPEDLRRQLEAAAHALGRQQWRLLHDALAAYLGNGSPLTQEERALVRRALRQAKE